MVLPSDTLRFHHNKTNFPLTGGHIAVDCRNCHETLVFSEASSDCISCHTDVHQQTVGTDCARCHTPNNWLIDNVTALHQENGFPLTGVHKAISCNDCHVSESALRFDRLGNDCVSCHINDFNGATNPNHGQAGFSKDCLECHDVYTPGWRTNKVNHDFFPLTKGHDISDCAQCHTGGDFANTPNTCVSCHLPDFESAVSPNHVSANFTNDCAACHTTDPDWMPSQYLQHDVDYFPIYSGKHLGQWQQCSDCHTNASNYAEYSCIACHINPETDVGHDGVVGYVYENSACLACHPTGDADGAFDHNLTDFPLTGAHLTTACIACHANGYAGTPTDCASCHTMDFNQTVNPNHNNLGLSTDCASCHTTAPGWAPATFAIHNDYYALNGAHAAIANDCATCHNGNYNNTPNTCAGCHTPDYNQAMDPDHSGNQFPTDCATCHSETAWAPATFDHNAFYPFTGAHMPIANDCAACHHGDYTNTPNTCAGCHQVDFNSSTNPNHVSLGFPTDCAMCHTTAPNWEPASFPIHNNYYALNGAHAAIANDCATCHNGDYNNTPNTCVGCHQADYNATNNPDHAAAHFPTDCAGCHTEGAWSPATFDHDGQYFPIYSGKHDGEWNDCIDCHTNPSDYTVFTCTTCHANPETDNQHEGVGGYTYTSTACLACHPTGDADNVFDHNTTAFPLSGAHLMTDCIECHASGYAGTPTDCASCHTLDYDQAANPNHTTLGLPTDCASCHTTAPGWAPATFAIHNDYYALNGAHAAIANDCAICHNGNYTNTPNTCAGCHTPDYNQAMDPDHSGNQFPTDCATCHSETAWAPATFDHNAFYPFTGAHMPIANDCAACHHGDYTNTPNTCAGCHQVDFNSSTNPNHVSLGFPTDCAMCHTTAPNWEPASFPIHNNYYALNGAHAAIANDCATCHNGDYNNTPNTCVGCHQADYNATNNPDHAAAHFTTDCATCHTEGAWSPSTFDHDGQYFPIYSGKHDGEWNACTDCHTNPSDYSVFTCTTCHMNPETNNQHNGVGGYSYNSTACLACHPSGDADLVFDHNTTAFQLTGAHLTADCLDCHSAGFQGTSTACVDCHTQDFDQTVNPNHGGLGFSTDCASCHTTAAGWSPAMFAIHNDYYALNGAHAAVANDCAACHNGNYTNTPNTCVGCHQADYNATTDPNHADAQFPTDCATCHSESAWAPATFNHAAFYPFTGAHIPIANDCAACHHGNYTNTPNTCAGCHQADYNGSSNPNHQSLGLPLDCEMCHTTNPGWDPATFPIHNNYYTLNGAHAVVVNDCAACHNGNYNNTPNTCAGCHQADYNATINPNHADAQFPVTCENCHSESTWVPSTFNHAAFYPFTGAHIPIANDCNACHHGDYVNTPNTCAGCHLPDFNSSTNPNHVSLGIPTDCAMCHTTTPDWNPATFPIHNNYWVLSGAHAAIANDCAACHNGNYNNTPNTCVGCHLADYNSANNPNHASAGFPTDCTPCHTVNAWDPSTFNHDSQYFPIYSGKHDGEWNQCVECHTTPGNFTVFSCIQCHEHNNPSQVANDHENVSGYQYLSSACYACHPDGSH